MRSKGRKQKQKPKHVRNKLELCFKFNHKFKNYRGKKPDVQFGDSWETRPALYVALINMLKQHKLLQEGDTVFEPFLGESLGCQWSSDQVMRGANLNVICEPGKDFLTYEKPPQNVKMIITNPPYTMIREIIKKFMEWSIPFAMIMSAHYVYGILSQYSDTHELNVLALPTDKRCFHRRGTFFGKPPRAQVVLLGYCNVSSKYLNFDPEVDVNFGMEIPLKEYHDLEPGQNECAVEKIVDYNENTQEYLIRWSYTGMEEWLPAGHLYCSEMVNEYHLESLWNQCKKRIKRKRKIFSI